MSSAQPLARRRTTVPSPPRNATAAGGDTVATVSFLTPDTNGGSPITQYRAISTPGSFTQTGASSPLIVAGLTNGVSYTFTVRATNALGNSAESANSNAVTPSAATTPPGAPTGPSASAGMSTTHGDYRATVSFSAPASDGGSAILDYTVTASPTGISATGAGSPITVTGLPASQGYTFSVTARNAIGTGPASSASNSVTPTSVPSAPATPTATATSGQATVSSTGSVDNGGSTIISYTATSSPGGLTATGAMPLTVTGLTNGQAYTFTVKANNAVGQSAASAASNSVTPNVTTHTVSASPSDVSASRLSSGNLSDNCTATVHDGVGPFLYAWAWIAGGSGLTLFNDSTATVTVSGHSFSAVTKFGTMRCTVTDQGNSNITAIVDVDVAFEWSF